jgi:hypothetical protein
VAGGFDLPIGPTFKISPEASYANVSIDVPWQSMLSKNSSVWIGGGTFEWAPVHGLAFDLDLLYISGHQDQPGAWGKFAGNMPWKADNNGFFGEFRIERDF